MAPKHQGGMMLVLGGGGSPSAPAGGDSPDSGKSQAAIPLPKGFDTGGAQPGDTITVQMDCKISDDGTHLIPVSVDGSSTDDDSDSASSGGDQSPAGGDDDGSTPGSRWSSMIGGQ